MIAAAVVGGGPAGLAAAEVMAAEGLRVTVYDAMPTMGRKFLMAGKSGLNLTNDTPPGTFGDHYDAPQLRTILRAWGPSQVAAWAEGLGQPLFTGSSGRIFPVAMKASPLLRAWLARLTGLGVRVRTRWRWTGFDESALCFSTPDGPQAVRAGVTVFAMGGGSWARLGSDGAWARPLGAPMEPFRPSNAALAVAWSDHMRPHFGAALKAVRWTAGGLTVSRAEAVISQRGLEGAGVYALSPAVRADQPVSVDLAPDLTADQIAARLSKVPPKTSIAGRLRKALRLSPVKGALLREWGAPLPPDAHALAQAVKAVPVRHGGFRPLDEAISTAGGVRFDALTPGLMLRARPGLFCAGEMLDWDAPTGGYLLTACFATGRWAAEHAARFAIES